MSIWKYCYLCQQKSAKWSLHLLLLVWGRFRHSAWGCPKGWAVVAMVSILGLGKDGLKAVNKSFDPRGLVQILHVPTSRLRTTKMLRTMSLWSISRCTARWNGSIARERLSTASLRHLPSLLREIDFFSDSSGMQEALRWFFPILLKERRCAKSPVEASAGVLVAFWKSIPEYAYKMMYYFNLFHIISSLAKRPFGGFLKGLLAAIFIFSRLLKQIPLWPLEHPGTQNQPSLAQQLPRLLLRGGFARGSGAPGVRAQGTQQRIKEWRLWGETLGSWGRRVVIGLCFDVFWCVL